MFVSASSATAPLLPGLTVSLPVFFSSFFESNFPTVSPYLRLLPAHFVFSLWWVPCRCWLWKNAPQTSSLNPCLHYFTTKLNAVPLKRVHVLYSGLLSSFGWKLLDEVAVVPIRGATRGHWVIALIHILHKVWHHLCTSKVLLLLEGYSVIFDVDFCKHIVYCASCAVKTSSLKFEIFGGKDVVLCAD